MITTTTTEALKCLKSGLASHPIKEDKLAILKAWPTDYPKTEAEIAACFNVHKSMGIICGKASGNLEAIDIDKKYDLTGFLWSDLTQMIEDNLPGLLATLPIAQTPSGGFHIPYRCEEIGGNMKLANRPASEAEKAENPNVKQFVLLETRGEGGYIAAYPTKGYRWIQGGPDSIPTITREQRACLLSVCRSFDQMPAKETKAAPAQTAQSTEGSPFDAWNEAADIPSFLEEHGWKVVEHKGDRVMLLRPGKTTSRTSANWHTTKRLLYVFSSSTEFDPSRAYNAVSVFQTVTGLDKKGVYKNLLAMGYGKPYNVPDNKPGAAKHRSEPPAETLTGENEEDSTPEAEPYIMPFIPDRFFELLPDRIKKLCALVSDASRRDKDVFLLSLLAKISGLGLGSENGTATNEDEDTGRGDTVLYNGKLYSANIFLFIAGPSGNGKAYAGFPKSIAKKIETAIWERNDAELKAWKTASADKNNEAPDKPTPKILSISGAMTKAKLVRDLANNPAGVIIYDSEADGLAVALKSDHGNFSDVLRKAAEHELVDNNTVSGGYIRAKTPRLSICVTGTHNQVSNLFKNSDDGLFGRFQYYKYYEYSPIRNCFGSNVNISTEVGKEAEYYSLLRGASPMELRLTETQQAEHFALSLRWAKEYKSRVGADAQGYIVRQVNRHTRICMLLERVLRGPEASGVVYCTQSNFDAATLLIETLIKHLFIVLDGYRGNEIKTARPISVQIEERVFETENKNKFFESLPPSFTTAEATEIAQKIGIPKPTLTKMLKKIIGKAILKDGHGKYRKA